MPDMDGGVTGWVEDSYAQVQYSKQAVSEKKKYVVDTRKQRRSKDRWST